MATQTLNVVELEMLVQYHYKRVDLATSPPSAVMACRAISHMGLLEQLDGFTDASPIYEITEKGKVYVEFLLCVPLPVEVKTWVITP